MADMTPAERRAYERGYRAGFKAARVKPWSKRDVARLVKWTGHDAELAAELGRSPLAVRLKRHKMRKAGLL